MKVDENLRTVKSRGIKAHGDFLVSVLEENPENFRRIMREAAEEDPRLFLRYYAELSKLLVPKQQDVNVSLTLNQDFIQLQALASSGQQLESEFVQYEELGPPAIETQAIE